MFCEHNLAEKCLQRLLLQALAYANWQYITFIMLLFSTLATPATIRAEQWFISEPLLWDARFMFDGIWRENEISPGNTQDLEELRYREQFSFKQRVHIIDPGIITFTFDLRPTFSQTNYRNGITTNNSDTDNLNYAVNSSFLHGAKTPLSLSAGIDRTTGITNDSFGARTDSDVKNQHMTLNLKNVYFPSSISYSNREQDLVRDTGTSSTLFFTRDNIKRLIYRGRSRKMNLNIEQVDYTDKIYDRNYTFDREQLNHNFSWGKNSSLRSRLENSEQKGFGAYKNTIINENARLQHNQKLFSTYQYTYNKTERTTKTTSHTGNIDVSHQLYSNLTTQVGYQHQLNEYSNGSTGESTTRGPRYNISYNKKLPINKSNIALGVSGSRFKTEQNGGTQLVDVLNVSKTFETDRIILSERYIDVTTIDVANSTTGAIYIEGTDYTIAQAPSGFTEIYRIPAASGGNITIDEEVIINYSHWLPGNVSDNKGYFFRLNIKNFQLYHNQSMNTQMLDLDPASLTNVTFPSSFLSETHTKESSTGITYYLTKEKLKYDLRIESRHSQLDDYEARSRAIKHKATYAFSPFTTLYANLSHNSTKTTLSDANSISAKASLNMKLPSKNASVKSRLSYRQQDDSIGNDDTFFNGGVDFEWRYHLLTFEASLDHFQWNGTTRNSEDNRLMLTLIRRSR